MKRFVLKCIAAAVAITTLCTSALAAVPYTVGDDFPHNKFMVTVTGAESEKVTFQILKKGKSFEDWNGTGNLSDFVLWQKQVTIDDTNEYIFTVPYSDELPAGKYEYRVVSDTAGVLTNENPYVEIVGTTTFANALTGILDEADAPNPNVDDVEAYIDGADGEASPVKFDLSIFNELSDDVKDATLVRYLAYVKDGVNGGRADYLPRNHYNEDSMASRSANFNMFMLFAALEEGGIIEDLETALTESILATDEAELIDNIGDWVVYDYEWKYITNKLETAASDNAFDNASEFKQALIEALILCETRYADGDDIRRVLGEYGSEIEIDSPSTNKKVYAAMKGNDYKNIGAFKEAYNGYVREFSVVTNNNGGGGNSPSHWAGKYDENNALADIKTPIQIPYVDIEGIFWAADAIIALTDMGIVQGKGDGYFEPESSVTREEFVKILVGALGYANVEYTENHFADVADNDWFCKYVNIAYEKGLVNGIGQGMFGVGQELTRQDMVVMLYNALVQSNVELTAGEASFDDDYKIADYAKTAVGTLYTMNVVNGVSDTAFDPLGIANRAQAAKVVYGVMDLLK